MIDSTRIISFICVVTFQYHVLEKVFGWSIGHLKIVLEHIVVPSGYHPIDVFLCCRQVVFGSLN